MKSLYRVATILAALLLIGGCGSSEQDVAQRPTKVPRVMYDTVAIARDTVEKAGLKLEVQDKNGDPYKGDEDTAFVIEQSPDSDLPATTGDVVTVVVELESNVSGVDPSDWPGYDAVIANHADWAKKISSTEVSAGTLTVFTKWTDDAKNDGVLLEVCEAFKGWAAKSKPSVTAIDVKAAGAVRVVLMDGATKCKKAL